MTLASTYRVDWLALAFVCLAFLPLEYVLDGTCDDATLGELSAIAEDEVSDVALTVVSLALPLVLRAIVLARRRRLDVWSAHEMLFVAAQAIACTMLVVRIMKKTAGRLRPDAVERSGGELDVACMSYPSGHAAVSAMGSVLASAVLWDALPTGFAGGVASALPQAWAIYVLLTRVVEEKHHHSDVNAGYVLGAIVSVVCWASRKQRPERPDESKVHVAGRIRATSTIYVGRDAARA